MAGEIMPEDTQTQDKTQTNTTTTDTATTTQQTTPQTFTQEDVDRIVKERLKRDGLSKTKVLEEFVKELGFEKADDLKATVKAKKEADEAAKSAEQKQIDQINQLMADLDAEKKRAADIESARRADKINSKLEALASASKAQVPDDVVDYLHKNHAEDVNALLAEDGKFDDKAAHDLIEAVRKARTHWFGIQGMGTMSLREGKTTNMQQDQRQRGTAATQRAIKRGGF
jgi:hypothetical protein